MKNDGVPGRILKKKSYHRKDLNQLWIDFLEKIQKIPHKIIFKFFKLVFFPHTKNQKLPQTNSLSTGKQQQPFCTILAVYF